MKVKVHPSLIEGKIKAPPSKSIGIRLIFLSLLTKVNIKIENPSDDIKVALEAVNAIKQGRDYIYLGGSATALRMLIPIVSALGKKVTLDGDETLRRRPLVTIFKALKGVKFSSTSLPLTLEGKLEKEIEIDGWESSQYISGLIYAYHILGGGMIKINPPLSSTSYIRMTIDVFNKLGSDVKMEDNIIYVNPGNLEQYNGYVPGDFALASFYAIASLLTGGKLEITGLYEPPNYFGDHSIVKILSKMNAKSFYSGSWIIESSPIYYPVTVDVNDAPDLAPSIATIASIAKGVSELKGVERLRIKESDRISTIISTLKSFNICASYKESIIVHGGKPQFASIVCPKDHRIAMMGGDLSLLSGGEIEKAECVNKSNPKFWEDLIMLGGKINIA
ncbi:3-phosphoshikimate 1-carboxyvinyltransferase [Candidatus Acidianus copahuensis]|uniref:3-phosphoshikimate 1-carboxyvinyltransferase n=1 Tax=Candidatus Acidianus copahuensis TaxID=1160895 RepID=A0A031LQE6_9CREN|nr:3-phosphoshikimate 1-carboxyvinyltransferase [Candidatus Acidianus copahuensis]EZQ06965.1 3-phosphoshikimate 1-carboxyvinyltransferase [Candidatus Acidianus copahuensis]